MIQFHKKNGFSLLESLLYIACSSILSYFFCSYMFSLHQALNKNFSSSRIYLKLYTAHDKIIDSLQKALLDKTTSFFITDSELSLSNQIEHKKWSVEHNQLILTTRNVAENISRKTVVAESIERVSFLGSYLADTTLIGIDCFLTSEKIIISRYCAR